MGLHINPLKRKVVLVTNDESGGTVEKEEPMSWVDAAKVSLVIMLAQIFMVWLPRHQWPITCWEAFCFDLLCFAGQAFFATFIALTGLSRIATRK